MGDYLSKSIQDVHFEKGADTEKKEVKEEIIFIYK